MLGAPLCLCETTSLTSELSSAFCCSSAAFLVSPSRSSELSMIKTDCKLNRSLFLKRERTQKEGLEGEGPGKNECVCAYALVGYTDFRERV